MGRGVAGPRPGTDPLFSHRPPRRPPLGGRPVVAKDAVCGIRNRVDSK